VQRTPDAVAVVFDDQCITYAQLNAQSNQLARYLQRHGIRRGSLVALHMERSSDLIVTLLAILKSGGAYLVVETDIPSRRLNSILEEARPAAIVAKSQREKVAINLIESVEGVKIASLPIVFCLDQDVKSISDGQNDPRAYDDSLGWKDLFAKGLEIISVTGDHHTMMSESHRLTLARKMTEVLNRYSGIISFRQCIQM
jgi:non-ribosomal peptide synthetase component F